MMTGVSRGSKRWLCLAVAAAVVVSCARATTSEDTSELECRPEFDADGYCDRSNNSAACGYDGGDCCSCTCEDSENYTCGEDVSFACIDPEADCVDDDDIDIGNVGCFQHTIGDSYCDTNNNIPECEYDGGDCCSCTCDGDDPTKCGDFKMFGGGGYDCQDPDAGCEDEEQGSVDPNTGCDDEGLGDGICDDVNNNENCGYDDGDCCICTCFVSPTEACGTGGEYDCIDPDADCDAEDGGDDSNSSQGSAGDEVVTEEGDDNSSGGGDDDDDDDGAAVPFDVDDGSDGAAGSLASGADTTDGGGDDDDTTDGGDDDGTTDGGGNNDTTDGGDDDGTTDSGGDDDSSFSSDIVLVEVGEKTGVSVKATAHDWRAGRSSDDVGCGVDGEGGCQEILTRDGVFEEIESRWSCATKIVEDGGRCEITFSFEEPQDIDDIEVAFWKGDERTRTLEVMLDGKVTHTHESYSGSTYNSLGVEANEVSTVTLSSIDLEEDEWISLLEVVILVKQ